RGIRLALLAATNGIGIALLAAATWIGTAPLAAATHAAPEPVLTRVPSSASAGPTFCAEWVRQSREGYERLTLFSDRSLVWKRSRDGKDDLLRKQIAPEELAFYCEYFARPEVWAIPPDMRTGLTGDFTVTSSVTLTRVDGARKTFRFDDLSPLPGEAATIRAALEGLKGVLTSPLAPASRFAADALAPGQLLKRFDGEVFRIRAIEREKGVVELEGVRNPYREFRKIEELRFQFSPPE
ncbi:MAG: hypothetical protein M3R62_06215, partial [Acidobacteriota bacterium]|nr:hypothetical protein [Acidobacteriota bacterium]